jgi:hypothetical protein
MPRSSGLFGFLTLFLLLPWPARAVDPNDVLESLLPNERLARVLNSDDITLNPNDPEPLFTPVGDFNRDGSDDIAISGIDALENGHARYFLLVAAGHTNPVHYDKLFYGEFPTPVFLHRPGTTGEYDPGKQAFSITACASCSDGEDFFWDAKKKRFERRSWEKRRRRYEVIQHRPEAVPDAPQTETALKIIGALPDVVGYVQDLKKHNRVLGTSADIEHRRAPDIIDVEVYEKRGSKKIIYDTFTVNVASQTIVKRGRNVKPSGAASNTSR